MLPLQQILVLKVQLTEALFSDISVLSMKSELVENELAREDMADRGNWRSGLGNAEW